MDKRRWYLSSLFNFYVKDTHSYQENTQTFIGTVIRMYGEQWAG